MMMMVLLLSPRRWSFIVPSLSLSTPRLRFHGLPCTIIDIIIYRWLIFLRWWIFFLLERLLLRRGGGWWVRCGIWWFLLLIIGLLSFIMSTRLVRWHIFRRRFFVRTLAWLSSFFTTLIITVCLFILILMIKIMILMPPPILPARSTQGRVQQDPRTLRGDAGLHCARLHWRRIHHTHTRYIISLLTLQQSIKQQ